MLRGWLVWPFTLLSAALVWRRGVAAATPRRTLAAQIALALYLGWLAGETFFPLPITSAALRAGVAAHPGGGWHADLTPFRSIGHLVGLGWRWPAIRLLAGNVCVFVPFGVLLPTAWAGLATWRRVALAALALECVDRARTARWITPRGLLVPSDRDRRRDLERDGSDAGLRPLVGPPSTRMARRPGRRATQADRWATRAGQAAAPLRIRRVAR